MKADIRAAAAGALQLRPQALIPDRDQPLIDLSPAECHLRHLGHQMPILGREAEREAESIASPSQGPYSLSRDLDVSILQLSVERDDERIIQSRLDFLLHTRFGYRGFHPQ